MLGQLLGGNNLQPTIIREIMYTDSSVIDSSRSTHAGSATSYWLSRNLPTTGKSTMDSTIGGYNCEVLRYYFEGHGSGNYVTNFKFYVNSRNAVATDMTFCSYSSDTFTEPSTISESDLYNFVGDWTEASYTVPASSNLGTASGFASTEDPTWTQLVYFGVVVESGATTGTSSWRTTILYQYT
jgi:hypothetical protein